MTRINLVPPSELTDQHLFAEFREIKMVPKSLARSLYAKEKYHFGKGVAMVLRMIPPAFTLNKGHVSFFYDKGLYLERRYEQLREELRRRGINFNEQSPLDPDGVFHISSALRNEYEPTSDASVIIRTRIAEKIAMKPQWYRYKGVPLPQSEEWTIQQGKTT